MEENGIKFISLENCEYPKSLKEISSPPVGIYIKGKLPKEDFNFVSIVGSRKVTNYGSLICEDISSKIARKGVVVVSGMAYGIDSIAHRSCLENGGKTIAVLGCGVDVCYPRSNESLYRKILENGCVISEFPIGQRPERHLFPIRNRIIAGLSKVIVVIEAGKKSGTLITAKKAIEYDKVVMAVPGNLTSKNSEGCNLLIKNGSKCLTCVEDVFEELDFKESSQLKNYEKEIIPLAEKEKIVYSCISYEPISFDEIALKLDISVREVMSIITFLELKQLIKKVSGQKVIKNL